MTTLSAEARIALAVAGIARDGMTDDEHHKQWVLDQTVRTLLGSEGYRRWLDGYNERARREGCAAWDQGIAPLTGPNAAKFERSAR